MSEPKRFDHRKEKPDLESCAALGQAMWDTIMSHMDARELLEESPSETTSERMADAYLDVWASQRDALSAATQRAEAAERERDAIINAVRAKCAEIRDTGKHCRTTDHKYNQSCDCREITADVESVLSPPSEAPKPCET